MQWKWDRDSEESFNGRYRPPDSDTVVKRSMCVAALVARAGLEEMLASDPDGQDVLAVRGYTDTVNGIDGWLEAEGLACELTVLERAMMSLPAGEWPRQHLIDANWRVEALAVLLWALSQIDCIPGYDTMADADEILNRSGLFKPVLDFGMSARLRRHDTLIVQREIAEIWRWRVNTGRLIREGKLSRATISIEDVICQAAEVLYETYNAVLPVDGDIVAFGKPVRDLDEEEFNVVGSIAIERNMALDWLCGYIDGWNGT